MRILLIVFLLASSLVAAQEDDMPRYTDADQTFSLPIPPIWIDNSTENMAVFVSPDESLTIYALAVDGDDVQTGIVTAIQQVLADFDAQPVQTNSFTTPAGLDWTQNIYALPTGEIIASQGTMVDGRTYVMIQIGTQAAFAPYNALINDLLFEFEVLGFESSAWAVPAYATPATFTETEVTITSGEYELPGTLTLPNGEGPFPGVVIVHGSGPSNRDGDAGVLKTYKDLAWGLASNGFAVLRYDKRTLVYGAESAPDPALLTVEDEVIADALAAVALLRSNEEVSDVFLIGHSLGAQIAPFIARRDPQLAGVVMLAPPARFLLDMMADQYTYLFSQDGEIDTQEQAQIDTITISAAVVRSLETDSDMTDPMVGATSAYYYDLLNRDAVAAAQTLDMPLFVLQGERDYQVTMEDDFTAWVNAFSDDPNVTLRSYPVLNHFFMAGEGMQTPQEVFTPNNVAAQVIDDIATWMDGEQIPALCHQRRWPVAQEAAGDKQRAQDHRQRNDEQGTIAECLGDGAANQRRDERDHRCHRV
jgi:uncharacterized protein